MKIAKTVRKEPVLKLSHEYGVDVDRWNWILYARNKSRDGEWTERWNAIAYYPSLLQLLERVNEQFLKDSVQPDLELTLDAAIARCREAGKRISEEIDTTLQLLKKTRQNRL